MILNFETEITFAIVLGAKRELTKHIFSHLTVYRMKSQYLHLTTKHYICEFIFLHNRIEDLVEKIVVWKGAVSSSR
jgi:hypothetical protein